METNIVQKLNSLMNKGNIMNNTEKEVSICTYYYAHKYYIYKYVIF